MTDSQLPVPSMLSAYQIFTEELNNHLQFLRETSGQIEQVTEEKELEAHFLLVAKKLEQRFHLIKGGAGFLQLTEIRTVCSEGEGWFKNGSLHYSSCSELKEALKKAVSTLGDEKAKLDLCLEAEEQEHK